MSKEFLYFLSFRFFTTVGLQMKMTLLGILLYNISKDVVVLGYMGLFEAFPRIFFALPAGYFVEKMEKVLVLKLILYVYILATLIILLSIFYFDKNDIRIEYFVYGSIFLMGIGASFGPSASISIFSAITSKRNISKYSAINSNAWQLGAMIGPLIAGILMQYFDYKLVLIAIIFTFIISLFSLMKIKKLPSFSNTKINIKNSILEIKEGLNFVKQSSILIWAISLDLFAVLFGGAIALLPLYKDILELNNFQYGFLKSSMSIGAVTMMFILSYFHINKKSGIKLLLSIFLFGVCMLIFGISKNFLLSICALFLAGAFDAISIVIRATLLILETPENMKSRVTSINQVFISSSNEIGSFESGIAAKFFGLIPSIIFGSTMTFIFVIFTFFKSKKLREFEFK